MNMKPGRILRHLATTHWRVRRAFPPDTVLAIQQAIHAVEADHQGEIRFAVEGALHPADLFRDRTPRERAIEVFSQLRVWDTQENTGVLIFVLLADRAVEIVADRGVHAKVGSPGWDEICRTMQTAFGQGKFREGALAGIEAVSAHLGEHYPSAKPGELPDRPVFL